MTMEHRERIVVVNLVGLDVIEPSLWSGKGDSNPRRQPWQGCTLPLSYSRVAV